MILSEPFGMENERADSEFTNKKMRKINFARMRCSHRSDSDSSISNDEFESLPTLTKKSKVPASTVLNSSNIFYSKQYTESPIDILDKIHKVTGVFSVLTETQSIYVENMRKSMEFDCALSYMKEQSFSQEFFAHFDKEISKIKASRSESLHTTLVEEFIKSVKILLRHHYYFNYCSNTRRPKPFQNPIPVDRFVHVLGTFARICNLDVDPGSAWSNEMDIGRHHVTSKPDLIIMPGNSDGTLASSVVSVAEEQLTRYLQKGKEFHKMESECSSSDECSTSNSDHTGHLVPDIYHKIPSDVLGKHGIDLLIHHPVYRKELYINGQGLNYLPGILAIGTEIVFTLLVIKESHIAELENMGRSKENKAVIYYSKPRDLLKKEDRDVLIEAFTRLSN